MTSSKAENRKKNFFGRNWSWLSAMAITAVFMVVIMIIMDITPFGTDCFTLVDSIHQYVPFFSDYQDKLLNGKSLFYTWDVGLGQNFQSLLLYYMASPLNLIIVFFTRRGIVTMFSVLVAVKIVLSAGSFGYLLSRKGDTIENNLVITCFSLFYALNNYMCGYYWNLMWLDCIMVFPLIILGFNRIIKKNDIRLYVLALFYSMYCNYYISFIFCIFLVLWFLATGHENVKKFIKDGLMFAAGSILAAAMAALSLIMAFLAITKTASSGSSIPKWHFYQNFFELIKYQFVLAKPINMDSFDGNANLYCGMLPYILVFVFIFSNKIKTPEKIRKILLIAFLLFSMNQEKLNFIWHGFHNQYGIPNRFSILYIFVILYIAYDVMSEIKTTSPVSIVLGSVAASVVLAFTYYKVEFKSVVDSKYMMIISSAITLIYAVFLMSYDLKGVFRLILDVALAFIMIVEVLFNAGLGMADHGGADGDYYLQYSNTMQDTVSEVEKLANAKGAVFYRSDIVSPIMLDENTYANIKGIGTFCTTVRGNMVDAMAHLGFYTGANEYLFLGSNPVTNDLLGVRYVYLRDGDFYPSENDYNLVYNSERTRVFENKNAMSVAYGVNEDLTQWDTDTYNCAEILNDFAAKAAGVGELFEEVHPVYAVSGEGCEPEYDSDSPNLISYSDGNGETITVNSTLVISEQGRYIINIRANYLENLVYYLNDEEIASDRYFTQLFDLGELKPGDIVRFKMEFNESYSPEGTISMFMSRLNKDNLTKLRGALQKNEMNVSDMTDNSIEGTVNLDKDQYLFTTIPYDEGWHAYVDGEEVDVEETGDGFLALWPEEGQHDITLKFIPDGFVPGVIISIIGWLIYIPVCIFYGRKKNAPKESETTEDDKESIDQ